MGGRLTTLVWTMSRAWNNPRAILMRVARDDRSQGGFFVEHKGDRARFEMHVWTAYAALLSLFEGRQVAPRVLLILI